MILWDQKVADFAIAVRTGMAAKPGVFEDAIAKLQDRHRDIMPAESISVEELAKSPPPVMAEDPRGEEWESL